MWKNLHRNFNTFLLLDIKIRIRGQYALTVIIFVLCKSAEISLPVVTACSSISGKAVISANPVGVLSFFSSLTFTVFDMYSAILRLFGLE